MLTFVGNGEDLKMAGSLADVLPTLHSLRCHLIKHREEAVKGLDLKFRKLLRSLISIGHDDRNACVFDERCFGGGYREFVFVIHT